MSLIPRSVENPARATNRDNRTKRKRRFVKSEAVAMIMAKTKEQAQGGTDKSWVLIAL